MDSNTVTQLFNSWGVKIFACFQKKWRVALRQAESCVCAALTRYWQTKMRTKTARATLQTSRKRQNESSSSSSPPSSWDVFSALSCPRSFMASSKRDRYVCRPPRGDAERSSAAASSGTLPRDSDSVLEEQASVPSRSSRGSRTLAAERHESVSDLHLHHHLADACIQSRDARYLSDDMG